MTLSESEQRFLARRARYAGWWPVAGASLLVLVVVFAAALAVFSPLFANPFVVFERLREDSIPYSSLIAMAALLPVVVIWSFVVLATVILLTFAALRTERRYLAIIERMVESPATAGGSDAAAQSGKQMAGKSR